MNPCSGKNVSEGLHDKSLINSIPTQDSSEANVIVRLPSRSTIYREYAKRKKEKKILYALV